MPRKGFGFIKPDDGTEDLFAHFRDIAPGFEKTLKEGQRDIARDSSPSPSRKRGLHSSWNREHAM